MKARDDPLIRKISGLTMIAVMEDLAIVLTRPDSRAMASSGRSRTNRLNWTDPRRLPNQVPQTQEMSVIAGGLGNGYSSWVRMNCGRYEADPRACVQGGRRKTGGQLRLWGRDRELGCEGHWYTSPEGDGVVLAILFEESILGRSKQHAKPLQTRQARRARIQRAS